MEPAGEADAGPDGRSAEEPRADADAGPDGRSADEPRAKPLLYTAILQRKSNAAYEIKKLLAQFRAEHGTMPWRIVYRVHSDMGTEFVNK